MNGLLIAVNEWVINCS